MRWKTLETMEKAYEHGKHPRSLVLNTERTKIRTSPYTFKFTFSHSAQTYIILTFWFDLHSLKLNQ